VALLGGCAGTTQELFWQSNLAVAMEEASKGNDAQAETDFHVALSRARRELGAAEVSESLFQLGVFLSERDRDGEALAYLEEALTLEEQVSGPVSQGVARRLAALADVYWDLDRSAEALPLVERVKPMLTLFDAADQANIKQYLQRIRLPSTDEIAALEKRAAAGDSKARYELAILFETGRGMPQDYDAAMELYLAAAHDGYLAAQYYVGVIFDKGRGVEVDWVKARTWYEKAARGGHQWAQFNYAVFLIHGRGGPKNEGEAEYWLQQSAGQGYGPAAKLLEDRTQ
jgi:TPR repeat protein